MLTTQTAAAPVATAEAATAVATPVEAAAAAIVAKKWAQVRIVTPQGAQTPIVPYANNAEFGYMRLESMTASFGLGSWARGSKRSTLVKADIATLEQILSEEVTNGNELPGKLVVQEFVLDDDFLNAPELAVYRSMLNGTEEDDIESRLDGIAKQAGKDGPRLTVDGAPILRFTCYIHIDREDFDEQVDIKVPHNNLEEVQAYQAEQKKAKLPTGGEN